MGGWPQKGLSWGGREWLSSHLSHTGSQQISMQITCLEKNCVASPTHMEVADRWGDLVSPPTQLSQRYLPPWATCLWPPVILLSSASWNRPRKPHMCTRHYHIRIWEKPCWTKGLSRPAFCFPLWPPAASGKPTSQSLFLILQDLQCRCHWQCHCWGKGP